VGSDAWTASYPSGYPDSTKMPASWIAALTAAENANLIPNIPLSNEGNYPKGVNAGGPEVCSSTVQCVGDGDVWNAPDGMLGVSFDDGPTGYSPPLYAFLKAQNQRATHFFIGANVLGYWQNAVTAFQNGDDLACHTWSHRYMTGLSNADVVAEFAYTLQIISDITGGRVPKFWRPPYGDSDNRVRAIAKHIFGLTQVDWNQDTNDWQLGSGGVTPTSVANDLTKWITGPKSPGLIILEHELSAASVQAFINAYPSMKSNGWDTRSIPDLFSAPWYTNAANDNSTVVPLQVINAGGASIVLSSTTTSAAPTTASSSPTTSPKNTAQNSGASSRYGLSSPLLITIFIASLFMLS